MRTPRVLVLAVQSPFSDGGAERHVRRLTEELKARGFEADLVTMPLIERHRFDLIRSALAWRGLDLTEVAGRPVDAVIATRFPSYAARHHNKVVWLIHQYRQAYDQFGTPYSDFTASREDRRAREAITEIDRVALTEARRVFANSETVAARLRKFNGIASEPLYHPPPLFGRYRSGPAGDYALTVGRLDAWKRADLPIAALAHAPRARLVVVGCGPEEERLRRLAGERDALARGWSSSVAGRRRSGCAGWRGSSTSPTESGSCRKWTRRDCSISTPARASSSCRRSERPSGTSRPTPSCPERPSCRPMTRAGPWNSCATARRVS